MCVRLCVSLFLCLIILRNQEVINEDWNMFKKACGDIVYDLYICVS